MIEYLVEEETFRHQPVSPAAVTTSGFLEDGITPMVIPEPTPNAMVEFQAYLTAKAAGSWELVQFERLASSSTAYKYLFIFTRP